MNIYPVDNAKGFANTYPLDNDLSFGERYPFFKQLVTRDFRRLPRPEYEMASCITSSFDSRLEKFKFFVLSLFFRTRVNQHAYLLLTVGSRFVATYTPFTPRLKSF